jgi:hypothetical protein
MIEIDPKKHILKQKVEKTWWVLWLLITINFFKKDEHFQSTSTRLHFPCPSSHRQVLRPPMIGVMTKDGEHAAVHLS